MSFEIELRKIVKKVISEAAFKNLFTLADKPLEKLGKIVAKSDEWYWTTDSVYDTLYMLVYQAHK